MYNVHKFSLFVVALLVIAACTTPSPVPAQATPHVTVGKEEVNPNFTLAPPTGKIAENYPLPLDGKLAVAPTEALIMTILVENETGAFVSFRVFRPIATAGEEVHFTVASKANHPWTVHRIEFTQWPDNAAILEVIDEIMILVDQTGIVGCVSPPCGTGEWDIQDVEEAQFYEIE